MENTRISLQQAIEKGYQYFVYPANGYQALNSLTDYSEDEIIWDENPTLCHKEPQHPAGMDVEELRDHLADLIADNHASETGCDTDDVYDAIKEIDFSDIAGKIQEKLERINFYWQSDVELIKSE